MTALFPCGSITGAPKIRTMEIIRELEPFPRGIYTGTIGYLSPGGDCVFNVAIRTVVLDSTTGVATFGVGGRYYRLYCRTRVRRMHVEEFISHDSVPYFSTNRVHPSRASRILSVTPSPPTTKGLSGVFQFSFLGRGNTFGTRSSYRRLVRREMEGSVAAGKVGRD